MINITKQIKILVDPNWPGTHYILDQEANGDIVLQYKDRDGEYQGHATISRDLQIQIGRFLLYNFSGVDR